MSVLLQRRGSVAAARAAGYTFPQNTAVLDNFDRADAALSPTANWTAISAGGINVRSNRALGPDNGTGDARWVGSSFAANQEVWATVPTKAARTGEVAGLFLRMNVSTFDGYLFFMRDVEAGTDQWKMFKYVSGTPTQLGSTTTGPELAAGDKIGFNAIGTALTAYVFQSGAWAQVMTVTDGTFSSAGHIGIILSGESPPVMTLDDFGGGAIV